MNTKTPVKIAVVIPKYGLVGGGEKFVAELTERIAERSSYEIHILAKGVNGFIVHREDIDAISRRILLLLDIEKRITMGLNAHKTAQNHNWDIMVNRVMELYEKILSSK